MKMHSHMSRDGKCVEKNLTGDKVINTEKRMKWERCGMYDKIRWADPASHLNPHEKNGVVWLSFPGLDACDEIIHGFSTRIGGVSTGIYCSMNLSFSRGDDPACVMENFDRISRALGFEKEQIVTSDQTHTTNLRVVGKNDRGNGITAERSFHDIDGLLTDEPGVVLATFYADCVPLYFYDPVHHAIALSHSGWRGTAGGMGEVTCRKMQEAFGSRPEDMIVAIGPSICQSCYEVSEDVIEEFRVAFLPELHSELFYRKANGKYQLDLWEANRQVLLRAGIKKEQIQMPGICTCCNPDFLFSHRATKGKRGNLGAFLMLKVR